MELSFFAEMAWKSALISAAALALAYVLRSRAAADRAMVLRLGVALLLLLPLLAMALPSLEIVAFAAPEAPPAFNYVLPADIALAVPTTELATAAVATEPTIWDDPTPLVILAYLGGLAMVGSRLLAGLFLLHRWTRSGSEVTCPEWNAALDRVRWIAGNAEQVRLLVSDGVKSPLSWGWRRPVILIDPDTLGQPDDAEGILAHEMAHVARRDWPMLMLSRVAATLFWFNPLVWMLEREVVQQAEEAADCEAASRVEPTRYAETLLSWAHVNGAIPANSIAPSTSALGRRVRAILDGRSRNLPSGSAWTGIAMVICLGIATPVAAMKLVAAAQDAPAVQDVPVPPSAIAAPGAPRAPDVPTVVRVPESDIVIDVPEVPDVGPIVSETLAAVLPEIPRIVAAATAAVHPHELDEALREAEAELRATNRYNREEIQRAMREARREIARARVEMRAVDRTRTRIVIPRQTIVVPQVDVATIVRNAQRSAAIGIRHGADGMMRGAEGMERGAARMEREAELLRTDRAHREREIERARARGETLTHEQLLEAAEGMREGAEGMRDGAREMREAAQRMRGGDDTD
jgi:beta-lactamase regulating signal transducer with metallopeptidase domain